MSQIYSFPVGLDALWQYQVGPNKLNPVVHDWLFNTGSLTERLQALTDNFEVVVIGQETVNSINELSLYDDEISALPNVKQHDWQVREVILYGDGKPWVFARSVLPDKLCSTEWSTLGNQPLGKRIFNDPSFVRGDFVVSQLCNNPLDKLQLVDLWARRSMFSIADYNLLVAEVFLPDCPCYQSSLQGES